MRGYKCEFLVAKSALQIELERQGHIMNGQELLSNHESDPDKPCFCGRPPIAKDTGTTNHD